MPAPRPREVRIRVEACGVCHSDASAKTGGMPGQIYPVIPGHEIAGVIDALGSDVRGWAVGQSASARAGSPASAAVAERCRRGDFMSCTDRRIHEASPATAAMPRRWSSPTTPGVDPGRALRHRGRATDALRRRDHLRALARCSARPGAVVAVVGLGGNSATSPCSSRREMEIRDGRRRPWPGQGRAGPRPGRSPLYRQHQGRTSHGSLQALVLKEAVIATAVSAEAIGGAINGLTIDGRMVVVGVPHEPFQIARLAAAPWRNHHRQRRRSGFGLAGRHAFRGAERGRSR